MWCNIQSPVNPLTAIMTMMARPWRSCRRAWCWRLQRALFVPLLLVSFGVVARVRLFAGGAAATTAAAFAPPHPLSCRRIGFSAGVEPEGASPDPAEASSWSPFAASSNEDALPPGFNPFQHYQLSTPGASNPTSATTTRTTTPRTFSLREAQMQQLTRALLDVAAASYNDGNVDDASAASLRPPLPPEVEQLLRENRDWFLAPLEDVDDDKNNDDDPASARARRYQAYRVTLQDRISQARTPQARWVLRMLRDYVESQE